jgi:hypothetical protein
MTTPNSSSIHDLRVLDLKLAEDGKSAEMMIRWQGRELTIQQTYFTTINLDEATDAMEQALGKMLALADVYQLGISKGDKDPTTAIELEGDRVTRFGGSSVQKEYENIEQHLQQKKAKLEKARSSPDLDPGSRLEKLTRVTRAIDLFQSSRAKTTGTLEAVKPAEPAPLDGRAKKELNEEQKKSAYKAQAIGLGIIFGVIALYLLPVTLLGLAIVGGIVLGRKFHKWLLTKIYPGSHLLEAKRGMKKGEEVAKLKAAQDFLKKELNGDVKGLTRDIEKKLGDEQIYRQAMERMELRKLGPPINSEKRGQAQKIVAELKFERPQNCQEQAKDFEKKLAAFVEAIKNPPAEASTRETNEKIIQKFREVLQCDAYQAMKCDPSDPAIQFIHRFAASIWTEVKAMDAYHEFGQAVRRRARELSDDLEPMWMTGAIHESMKTVRHDLLRMKGVEKVVYVLTHPQQIAASFVSEEHGLAKTVASVVGEYDSHGALSNNPSLQGATTIPLEPGQSGTVQNVYGGSPTVGELIAPEFLAVIQAAENNQFAEPEQRLAEVPDRVFYTNFQDISHPSGEQIRSFAIMDLNQLYPLSFTGITLTKDSRFYGFEQDPEKAQWVGPQSMADMMLERLMDPSSDHGFYFPGDREEEWKPRFEKVLKGAVELFKDKKPCSGEEAFKLRGAFQECVYASLQFYLEAKLVQDLAAQGIDNPRLHSQRACKENIDRGGAANAAYIFLRLALEGYTGSEEDKIDLVIGALHSRALAARDRMILENRLPQVLAFMDLVEPKQFWAMQEKLHDFDHKELRFTPALAAKT